MVAEVEHYHTEEKRTLNSLTAAAQSSKMSK
jgi:hypothetical protein